MRKQQRNGGPKFKRGIKLEKETENGHKKRGEKKWTNGKVDDKALVVVLGE